MSANLSENPGLSALIHTDLLKCPWCRKVYTKPRLLPCLHTVCHGCLEEQMTVGEKQEEENTTSAEEEEEESEDSKEKENDVQEPTEKTKQSNEDRDSGEKKKRGTNGKDKASEHEKSKKEREDRKKETEEEEMRSSFPCPECKTVIPTPQEGAEGFQTNYFLMALVDLASSHLPGDQECDYCRYDDVAATATSCCLDCQDNMCGPCTDAHRRTKITRQHQVLLFSEIPSGKYDNLIREHQQLFCKRHANQPISYFCNKCESIICDECKTTTHSEHLCSLLPTAGQTFIHQTKKSLSVIKSKVPKIQDHLKFITEYNNHVGEMHEEIRESIEAHTVALHKVIDKYKTDLLEKLEAAKEAESANSVKRQEDLTSIDHIYMSTLEYLGSLVEHGKHEEILAAKRSIQERLTQLVCLTLDSSSDNVHLRFTPGQTDKASLRAVFGKVEVSYGAAGDKVVKSSPDSVPRSPGYYGIKPKAPISSQYIPRMESMSDLRKLEDF